MGRTALKYLVIAGAALGIASCKDSTSPLTTVVSDAQLQSDVAASAGDAAANAVGYLIGNEASTPALPSSQPSFNVLGSPPVTETVTITRTRKCLDASDVQVVGCTPIANVKKIVTHFSVDGSRQGQYFTGAVHRVADDTTTRNFVSASEVSRTHSGVATAHDTTTFADATASGIHIEAAIDSINAVTFNLPRSTNPYPISGSLVRNVAVHASYTKGTTTQTRDFTKRIEIDFPADAQGNVVLKIDAKTCNLNLVTHAVTNCQ